jgi:hypothetical protein
MNKKIQKKLINAHFIPEMQIIQYNAEKFQLIQNNTEHLKKNKKKPKIQKMLKNATKFKKSDNPENFRIDSSSVFKKLAP